MSKNAVSILTHFLTNAFYLMMNLNTNADYRLVAFERCLKEM